MSHTERREELEMYEDGSLTVTEAAKFSGVGRTVLYELMTAGELPYTKVGARRLIPRRALVALLAKHATHTAT